MYIYKKSITGKADIQKIWELYSDVTKWSLWDESVKSVRLSGPFALAPTVSWKWSMGLICLLC